MQLNKIFSIYDRVSETFVSPFIAPTIASAKKSFDNFITQNKLDSADFDLYLLSHFHNPHYKDDIIDDFERVEFEPEDFVDDQKIDS